MVQPLLDLPVPGFVPPEGGRWTTLEGCIARVPEVLKPWLSEPGLLTARVRAACGPEARLRLLRLEPSPLDPGLARRLGVDDAGCLLREIEFTCRDQRWIFAQSVFPQSTVEAHPWLRRLGDNGLGETLSAVDDVRREPLEYRELGPEHPLAQATSPAGGPEGRLWARRAVYRLAGRPILVQEVFLPALCRCD
jgi:chorismate--pyruvate lyase